MNNILILSLIIIFFYACDKGSCLDEKLTLNKQDYTGNELKINGYYFCNEFSNYFIFYKNGISIFGITTSSEVEELEKIFKNGQYYAKIKNYKGSWGIFNLNNKDDFKIERLENFEDIRYKAYLNKCEVINDTTFILKTIERSNKKKEKNKGRADLNLTFHFRPLNPKPDSTNKFIK